MRKRNSFGPTRHRTGGDHRWSSHDRVRTSHCKVARRVRMFSTLSKSFSDEKPNDNQLFSEALLSRNRRLVDRLRLGPTLAREQIQNNRSGCGYSCSRQRCHGRLPSVRLRTILSSYCTLTSTPRSFRPALLYVVVRSLLSATGVV